MDTQIQRIIHSLMHFWSMKDWILHFYFNSQIVKCFCTKFRFSSKISIFEQNFDFRATFRAKSPLTKIRKKIYFRQHFDFTATFWFSSNSPSKVSIDQNFDFRAKLRCFKNSSDFLLQFRLLRDFCWNCKYPKLDLKTQTFDSINENNVWRGIAALGRARATPCINLKR